jgi:hypothetical protein
MHRATGADGAHTLVFDDLGAQHGQLKHLAALKHFVRHQSALAGAALGRAEVPDEDIEHFVFPQGVTAVLLSLGAPMGRCPDRRSDLGAGLAKPSLEGGLLALEMFLPRRACSSKICCCCFVSASRL